MTMTQGILRSFSGLCHSWKKGCTQPRLRAWSPSWEAHSRSQLRSAKDLEFFGWESNLPKFVNRQAHLDRLSRNRCELTYALTHPKKQLNGALETISNRLRDGSAVQALLVMNSIYFIEGNDDMTEYTFLADSASSAAEEIVGPETAFEVEAW